jgi:1-acyl-sn-glycerol-3-phosphate acyltransferase
MSYDFILEELTNLLDIYRISEKANLYIQDYMNAIRRNVVEDRELKELCRKIYYKHKEAFDLIFENLPDTKEGYILVANHQGKSDTMAILSGHKHPCSVLMDKKRSYMPIAKQFVDLLKGQRIDRRSSRQQIAVLNNIAKEVGEGRVYLVFPEGGYRKNQDNRTNEFKNGCFLCALNAKCPIVPVVLIDSYKPFGCKGFKPVTTKTVFLPPIPYEDFKDMKAPEVSKMVKGIIDAEIEKWTA